MIFGFDLITCNSVFSSRQYIASRLNSVDVDLLKSDLASAMCDESRGTSENKIRPTNPA